MFRFTPAPLAWVAVTALVAGCRVVKVGVIAVAAAVGITGYAIYKTGDAAVTGVGKAGEAVVSGSKSVATVIYANGELNVEHPFDVRTVCLAASLALRKAGFSDVKSEFDALSGAVRAKTREGAELALKLRAVGARATQLRIRVGVKGDLKTAELIDTLILRELPELQQAVPASAPAQEEPR